MLTPTIHGREQLLDECCRSVLAQTYPGWEHLRLLDEDRQGCARTMNQLAEQARGDWLLPLADDDLLLPGCLKTMLPYTKSADIVYSPPLVAGHPTPEFFCQEPPVIPSFALIARESWFRLGGYDYEWFREEDRRMWIRALDEGMTFARVNSAPTWVYRFHGGNKSHNNGVAS